MVNFGDFIRERRERLRESDPRFSLRQVAQRIGVEPSYISQIERGVGSPPSEEMVRKLADEVGEDPDVLLAMCGKVSRDLRNVICRRPKLFSQLIRELKGAPDHAILKLVREVRDGDW